ncbi:MAG: hypothetical protein HGA93_06650 [Methanothrix sp.]|nr:hypothetical protein [Methanothrix sp.]
MSGEAQEVMAIVEGDEESIKDFTELIKAQKPEHAEVSNIAFGEYNGNVMRTGEFAQVCAALQLNKAIPLLLDMRDDLRVVRKNTDPISLIKGKTDSITQILEEIKGMREGIQPRYAIRFRQV